MTAHYNPPAGHEPTTARADGPAAAAARARLTAPTMHNRFGRRLVNDLLAEHDTLRAEIARLQALPDPQPLAAGPHDEPQTAGDVVAVHHGDYRNLEVWVRSGVNIGCWYLLGGEHGRRIDDGIPRPPQHPTWDHVLARGPVTLLTAGHYDTYATGWTNGCRRLLQLAETLMDTEIGDPS